MFLRVAGGTAFQYNEDEGCLFYQRQTLKLMTPTLKRMNYSIFEVCIICYLHWYVYEGCDSLKNNLCKARGTEIKQQASCPEVPVHSVNQRTQQPHCLLGSHRPARFFPGVLAALLIAHASSMPTPALPILALFTTCLATDLWVFSSGTSDGLLS